MSSSLTDIRVALKATMAQAGLEVYDTVTDVVNTPAVVVEPGKTDFTNSFHQGGDTYNMNLYVLVANTDPRNAQQILDQYVTGKGPKSIRDFLWQNSTLGLADVDSVVTQMDGYGGKFQDSGFQMIGARLRVVVTVM
jgi:hypothetical protein